MTDHEQDHVHAAIRFEKGTSGLQISVCECGLRFVPGVMGSPASYMSPEALDRLRVDHPDLYEEYVTEPRKVNEARRQATIANLRQGLNGKD